MSFPKVTRKVSPTGRWYLHDLARAPRINPGERFDVSCDINPRRTMIYLDRSHKRVMVAKHYLEGVWGKTV